MDALLEKGRLKNGRRLAETTQLWDNDAGGDVPYLLFMKGAEP